jgi:protoheme IX farnesyltransferase
MVISSVAVVWSANFTWWIWVITILLALGFVQQLVKLNADETEKSAGRLFQWSITYLSVYSLLLVAGVFL